MTSDVDEPPTVVTSVAEHQGFRVVFCTGAIDVATSDQLRTALTDALLTPPHRAVADLSAVYFVDSTALGVLVGLTRRAHEMDGLVRVVAPRSGAAGRALHLLGLDRVVDCRDNLAAATADPQVS